MGGSDPSPNILRILVYFVIDDSGKRKMLIPKPGNRHGAALAAAKYPDLSLGLATAAG